MKKKPAPEGIRTIAAAVAAVKRPKEERPWRTFVAREEVWVYLVGPNPTKMSTDDGVNTPLPGDFIVDTAGQRTLVRRRDFWEEYKDWNIGSDVASGSSLGAPGWYVVSRTHTIRIRQADPLYDDLFHWEKDGELQLNKEGTAPESARWSGLEALFRMKGYQEVEAGTVQ